MSPPDLDPSDKEQEEDCNIGQHLELAMKFGEELGHVQMSLLMRTRLAAGSHSLHALVPAA